MEWVNWCGFRMQKINTSQTTRCNLQFSNERKTSKLVSFWTTGSVTRASLKTKCWSPRWTAPETERNQGRLPKSTQPDPHCLTGYFSSSVINAWLTHQSTCISTLLSSHNPVLTLLLPQSTVFSFCPPLDTYPSKHKKHPLPGQCPCLPLFLYIISGYVSPDSLLIFTSTIPVVVFEDT